MSVCVGLSAVRAATAASSSRAVRVAAGKLGVASEALVDDLAATVGNAGAAQPGLGLARLLEDARPGQVVALAVLADGAEVLLFRVTDAIDAFRSVRPLSTFLRPRRVRCGSACATGGAE